MEKFEDKINKEEEEESDIERQEKERIKYLIRRTEGANLMHMPSIFYFPKILNRKIEELAENLGGFDNEEQRRKIARHYNSLVPKYFYLIEDYIFVIDSLGIPELAHIWDKDRKEQEKSCDMY
jgi:hypothetical protein